ncbi:hypothetical protein [Methylobacterium sp. Leaf361]|uniref:hypothetical protein n=1 Tax=Methylobacterium sp. Leaf361 TaxID=1736352 RepID=UPI000AA4B50A|nr:hypothetical protein [Methylobacterium sp. Leaf361]
MTVRSAFAAAALATSLATIAAPALAQQAQTFEAWGHTFNVPGSRPGVPFAAHRGRSAEAKASVSPGQSYASGLAGSVTNATTVDRQAPRRINVWGSWLDAPNY